MLMCFYLLPFLAFSREGNGAATQAPSAPPGLAVLTIPEPPFGWWWWLLDRLVRTASLGKGHSTRSSSCKLSVRDTGPSVCCLLEVPTGPVL